MATIDQLLALLSRHPNARATELADQLKTSRPSVLRLIAQAQNRICRVGRGPSTRYARTREVPPLGTHVAVRRIDETGRPHPYATLHFLAEGHHWLEPHEGDAEFFVGLPPFAVDMSPQGYIGRAFTHQFPELHLPPRVVDWTDDHRLIALAMRGQDTPGNLIIGDESLNRFLSMPPAVIHSSDYPRLADASGQGQPGSSAGGEQPKFVTSAENRHVIVKFAGNDGGASALRWMDLLVCEALALQALRAAGFETSTARWLDGGNYRFLEVERFDRVGVRGRRALLSLSAISNEYLGVASNWTEASKKMRTEHLISDDDARRVRWLDTFGQLIGNTDRHFGNLSFFPEGPRRFRLAPVYDMLPMVFAPMSTTLIERDFKPLPPTADNLDVWPEAAHHALNYWEHLSREAALSTAFRERCAQSARTLGDVIQTSPV